MQLSSSPKFSFTSWLVLIICLLSFVEAISGIALIPHYRANAAEAFDSLQQLMQSENYSWFWRDLHVWGANLLFLVAYVYLGAIIWQQQFQHKISWLLKMVLLIGLFLSGFSGNILPWSQLSLWLVNIIPAINLSMAFIIHVLIVPILFIILFVIYILRKHRLGRLMHSKILAHLSFRLITILILVVLLVLCRPNIFYLSAHLFSANSSLAPLQLIAPWYLAPWHAFYQLTSWPGLIVAIMIFVLLPWFMRPVIANLQQQFYHVCVALIILSFFLLGLLEQLGVLQEFVFSATALAILYFCCWAGLIFYTWRK